VADASTRLIGTSVRGYKDIAVMWTRAAMAYPASFWMMCVSGFVVGLLDFVGIWIMFHTVDALGGWSLSEIAFLYGATGFALAAADLVVGRIERLGQMIRTGRLDAMFLKPMPLLIQVCADEFALRRFARVSQAVVILAIACTFVSWTPAKALVTLSMLVSGSVIFFAVFIGFACIQFWTIDANEVANAFTYGGNTITQYPMTVFPKEIVKGLTFLLPLAFVNWYPALYVLDKPDPFGFPEWLQFASPIAAVVLALIAWLVWHTGVRHYTSTGS
jgi:ABC-2 type transport system permease protein